MRIAYQGETGAFSEAASRQVDASAELLPCKSFEDVFGAVEAGAADYGVLPIENSIGGSIHRNFDLLLEHQLPIVGEVEVPVVHHLLALPGRSIADVKRVYSHPQALAQCDRFLRTLSGVEIIATYDTAGSAKMIADQKLGDAAAIASERAAQVFGLETLRSSIQDYETNTTRFLVVGRAPLSSVPANKTTIVFTLTNEPGALFKALAAIALRDIALTKLESRPTKKALGDYCFIIDLEGHLADELVADCLRDVRSKVADIKFLGSYPAAGEHGAAVRRDAEASWRAADAWITAQRAKLG